MLILATGSLRDDLLFHVAEQIFTVFTVQSRKISGQDAVYALVAELLQESVQLLMVPSGFTEDASPVRDLLQRAKRATNISLLPISLVSTELV